MSAHQEMPKTIFHEIRDTSFFLLPEEKLWPAVLHRALLDACGSVGKSTGDTRRRIEAINKDAINWFEDNHVGLQIVCEMIGLDSDKVRRLTLRKIRQNEGRGLVIQTVSKRRPYLKR